MKKRNIIIFGAIVILIVALAVFLPNVGKSIDLKDSLNNSNQVNNSGQIRNSAVPLNEFEKHSSREDCWIEYENKIYDITEFLPKHKGSAEAIIPYCGKVDEFEEAFRKQHGTSKVALLMKVGVLMGDFDYQGDLNDN